jgi:hypothetical protein
MTDALTTRKCVHSFGNEATFSWISDEERKERELMEAFPAYDIESCTSGWDDAKKKLRCGLCGE